MSIEPLQAISMAVTLVTAGIVGVLAHRSPKGDWEFIKAVPSWVLVVVSGGLAQAEMAAAVQLPPLPEYSCEWVQDPVLVLRRECGMETGGGLAPPAPPDLGALAWTRFGSTMFSMALDVPPALLGVWAGVQIGKATTPAPPVSPVVPADNGSPASPPAAPVEGEPNPRPRRRRKRPQVDAPP